MIPYGRGLKALTMPVDYRGFLTGASGSGKSTLARTLLLPHRSLVIIDPKDDFHPIQPYSNFRSPAQFLDGWRDSIERYGRIARYVPEPEFDEVEAYDELFKAIFFWSRTHRGGVLTYCDEVTSVAPSALKYGRYFRALYLQGRALGAGMLAGSQRPSVIPSFVVSEALKLWMFYLHTPADLKKMEAIMGTEVRTRLPRYHFWYKDVLADARARAYVLEEAKAA